MSPVWTAYCHSYLLHHLVSDARTSTSEEVSGVKRVQGFLHDSNVFSFVSSGHTGKHPSICKDPPSPLSPAKEKWAKISPI
jgi:hypothetical protein